MDTYANHSMGPSPNHAKSLHERLPSKDGNIIADSDSDLEVRHMETYANHSIEPSPKHETSLQGILNSKDLDIIADNDSDTEDVGHFPRQSKSRPVSRKSSPVRVYSYKVNHVCLIIINTLKHSFCLFLVWCWGRLNLGWDGIMW